MADQERSLADLQALLADNTQGLISPQDLRDFLVSVVPPHGSFNRLVAAATTITTPGTYVKAAGTTVAGADLHHFDMPLDGRLRYIGAPNIHAHVAVSLSMTTAGVNNVVGMKMAKNGTVVDSSVVRRRVSTGTDIGAAALHGDVVLATNDYLELFVTNETDTDSVTIDELYFFAMGMLT